MQLTRRVALNNAQLDAVNSHIAIQSVETADGRENITAVGTAAGFGQRVTGARRDPVDVIVRFGIDIRKTSLAERSAALEAVNAWAMKAADGAWMTVNYRTARRIRVRLVQAPGEGNLWDWTKTFQITFRAYGVPYWEDASENTKQIGTSAGDNDTINPGGSVPAQVNITMENTSGSTVNTATVNAGDTSMSFTSLGLANGEKLVIDHDDNGLVRIRIQASGGLYRSAMAKRTTASDDDLTVIPGGSRVISYTAGGACTVTAGWRARYL